MNKIGVSSGFYGKDWPVDFTDSIRKASQLGFDAIELFTAGMLDQPKQKLKEYVTLAAELGIELQYCTGLAPDCDLASPDESIRRNGIEHVKRTLDLIGVHGRKAVRRRQLHRLGLPAGRLREKPTYRERSITSIREIMPTAEALGITYCVEPTNRFEQFLLNTTPEGNAYLRGRGQPEPEAHAGHFPHEHRGGRPQPRPFSSRATTSGTCTSASTIGTTRAWASCRGTTIIRALGKLGYKGTLSMEPFIIPGGDVGQGCSVWHDRTGGATESELDEVGATIRGVRQEPGRDAHRLHRAVVLRRERMLDLSLNIELILTDMDFYDRIPCAAEPGSRRSSSGTPP